MAYRIEITRAAVRDLKRLPRQAVHRIDRAILALGDDPRPAGAVKLRGSDITWRIRVGDYRVIYEIHDRKIVIVVVRIRHRRDVYDR